MSIRVKARLEAMKIQTDSQERVEIDREIEKRTKMNCDKGIDKIDDKTLKEIVDEVRRRKKKAPMEIYA